MEKFGGDATRVADAAEYPENQCAAEGMLEFTLTTVSTTVAQLVFCGIVGFENMLVSVASGRVFVADERDEPLTVGDDSEETKIITQSVRHIHLVDYRASLRPVRFVAGASHTRARAWHESLPCTR